MTPVSITLPDRPLVCRPPGAGLVSLAVRCLIVLAVLWVGSRDMIPQVCDLIRDIGLADHAVPVPGGHAEGRCSTYQGFLTDCKVTLTAPGASRTVQYFFVDAHAGDYKVHVLADPARPTLLTTDLALAKQWNRGLSFVIATVLFALLSFALLTFTASHIRRQRATVRALSNQLLRPVLLRMTHYTVGHWGVSTADGQSRSWDMPRRARPIVMDPGRRLILGVTAGDGRFTLPLDRDLRWIGLADHERQAVLATLDPASLGPWLAALDTPASAAERNRWRRLARVVVTGGLLFSLATGAAAWWAFATPSAGQEAILVFALCLAFALGPLLGAALIRAKVARYEAILR